MMSDLSNIVAKYLGELVNSQLAGEPEEWDFPVSKHDLRVLLAASKGYLKLHEEVQFWEKAVSIGPVSERATF